MYRVGNTANSLLWLRNCSIIEGSLQVIWIVNEVTPANYTNIVLPDLEEITGYLLFFRVSGLQTIGQIFPNLRVIRAEEIFYGFGLVIYEVDDLQSISLANLNYLGYPIVAGYNPQLCFLHTTDWSQVIPKRPEPPVPVVYDKTIGKERCALMEGCSMACGANLESSRDEYHCWDNDHCQTGNTVILITAVITLTDSL